MRILLSLMLALMVALPLGACGRKGNPEPPDGTTYPRDYPYTPMPSKTESGKTR